MFSAVYRQAACSQRVYSQVTTTVRGYALSVELSSVGRDRTLIGTVSTVSKFHVAATITVLRSITQINMLEPISPISHPPNASHPQARIHIMNIHVR